jgi:hypothetical protein
MPSWNITKSLKAARNNALAGVQPPTPPDFSDIGAPPTIDVGGVTTSFVFGILGVVPQRVDITEAVLVETIERWPARPRAAGFPLKYQGLDAGGLDAEFITVTGLTASVITANTWVGYYPGLSSSTQVGLPFAVEQFAVGLPVSFTIAGGVSLYGTAYAPPATTVYAVDGSTAGTQWNGTISAVNYSTNTLTVIPAYISRPILGTDPTQLWSLYHTAAEAGAGEAEAE